MTDGQQALPPLPARSGMSGGVPRPAKSGLAVPDWRTDGVGWPNREVSQFVTAAGLRWHVQVAGEGPVLLLLHGTGAATHSWAGLLPLLARHFRVVAPDLPGHGFTQALPAARMSLTGMGGAVAELLSGLGVRPAMVAGHSAGAAILARMCLDRLIDPATLFALNGALLPLDRMPMTLFSPLARWLSANPLIPRLFAFHAADRRVVDRLLRNTGSSVPPGIAEFYGRLVRRPGHAAGALAMMAHWDLAALKRELGGLTVKLVMINGGNDRIIPPAEGRAVQRLLPGSVLIELPGLGHLAHEEAAAAVAQAMIGAA